MIAAANSTARPEEIVRLAYGRGYLEVARHFGSTVVIPVDAPALADPITVLRQAVRNPSSTPPLRVLAEGARSVAISVCDGTRAQPRKDVLRVLLEELADHEVDITVLIATGTHRGNTPAELREMLGDDVLRQCRVINHDARDTASLVSLGTVGNGIPLWLNRVWVDADLRITTGFVEPHFFAGFSGGPKMVAPGLAGLETVLKLHNADRIGDPRSSWGIVEDNPVHSDVRACAAAAPPQLAIDVLLDRGKQITHVFAGELFTMHEAARNQARELAMQEVDQPFDVVVTTNSGYPLDQNLYQAVKGMAAAERIVKPGGTIIVAAECSDGLPDHGLFAELLHAARSPADLLAMIEQPGPVRPDQWQVQILARILQRARVFVYCDGLTVPELESAHLSAIDDIDDAVQQALAAAGPDARVCYLPEGPQTIPYLTAVR